LKRRGGKKRQEARRKPLVTEERRRDETKRTKLARDFCSNDESDDMASFHAFVSTARECAEAKVQMNIPTFLRSLVSSNRKK
jgi:hypothetical protein